MSPSATCFAPTGTRKTLNTRENKALLDNKRATQIERSESSGAVSVSQPTNRVIDSSTLLDYP